MAGKYDNFWEMRRGGPYDEDAQQIFKCRECGAETAPEKGWDGEPDPGACRPGCSSHYRDWRPGMVSQRYRENFAKIFPGSPGADI